MEDERAPNEQAANSNQHPAPIAGVATHEANVTNRNPDEQPEKWYASLFKRIKDAHWTHVFEFLGICIGLTVAAIYWSQLQEMSRQTKTLENQVNLGVIASAGAAASTTRQLALIQEQANAARQSADAIGKQMRQDQRAWINVIVGQAVLSDNQPIHMPLRIANTGKTPAKNMDGNVAVYVFKRGEEPEFDYSPNSGHPHYGLRAGIMFPDNPVNTTLDVLTHGKGKQARPVLVTPEIRIGIQQGDLQVVAHGTLNYSDVFGRRHWMNFCLQTEIEPGNLLTKQTLSNATPRLTGGSDKCSKRNDTDNN